MSYPLSESFATAPVTGYTAVLGGMAATHNSAQQSIDPTTLVMDYSADSVANGLMRNILSSISFFSSAVLAAANLVRSFCILTLRVRRRDSSR